MDTATIEAVETVLTGEWTDSGVLTDEEFEAAVMGGAGNKDSGSSC